jgi:hypothetical protein
MKNNVEGKSNSVFNLEEYEDYCHLGCDAVNFSRNE